MVQEVKMSGKAAKAKTKDIPFGNLALKMLRPLGLGLPYELVPRQS